MQYTLLLWPHANARYQAETRRLALAELELMLARVMPEAEAAVDGHAEMPALTIRCTAPLCDEALSVIKNHSLLYGLFERREDGALMPLAGRSRAVMGEDLPAILKYKGKTNEMFLQLLINAALYSGDFSQAERIDFFDPMCGRATAPFIALNRGWNAVGADVDKNDLKEAEKFFKRYLEYHHFKYNLTRESRTVNGKIPVPVARFETAEKPQAYKAGDTLSLSLANLDAARAGEAFGKHKFHLIACDLPYGVAHMAQPGQPTPRGKNALEPLLAHALPGWHRLLKAGGTVALSFNAQTFRRDRLRELLAEAGFEPLSGGPYDGFEHWVEQAITRDIVVARKN